MTHHSTHQSSIGTGSLLLINLIVLGATQQGLLLLLQLLLLPLRLVERRLALARGLIDGRVFVEQRQPTLAAVLAAAAASVGAAAVAVAAAAAVPAVAADEGGGGGDGEVVGEVVVGGEGGLVGESETNI